MRQNILRFMICPALLMMLLMMLLAGCVKRDLEVRSSVVDGYAEIALDWGGDSRPQTARFLFYDESGKMVKEATGITDGFKGTLPAGKYSLVVHNEDAVQVGYRGTDSHSTAEVFAKTTDYILGGHPAAGIPCILEPQMVFGTGVCKEFEQIVIEAGQTTRATVCPVLLTRQVQFLFEVKGSTCVRSLAGVMGGIAPGVFLSTCESNTSTACAMEFTASPRSKVDAAEFVADIEVFNLLTTSESTSGTNVIGVILIENDGTRHEASFDLTGTLQEIIDDNGGVIPIEIPVEVVLEVQPMGGLTATVRPWDNSGTGSGEPRP